MQNNQIWEKGFKKTKQRECVLDVLLSADRPLTAMEIYKKTENTGTVLWLSTVYRILELFTLKGVVEKSFLAGGDIASYIINNNDHKHYAVCIGCNKIIALDSCPVEKSVCLNDFHVTGHKLEVYGLCGNCYTE